MPEGYRPSIDGLRAIAVLAVFVFHLNRQWLPGGFFGVDIFFVISGYLITSIILREREKGRFNFWRFYQRRIARLLPVFFVVALATLAGAAFIYSPRDLASTGATLSFAAGSAANLKFLLQGNYFVLSSDAQPFLQCWSLSLEEQFYLFFPMLLVWLYPRRSALIAAFVASFLSYLALSHVRPEWAFYLLPARAWELLAGALLITGLPHLPSLFCKWRGINRANPGVYLGFLLIAISFYTGHYPVLAVTGTALLLFTDTRVLSSSTLALVGRMSYSLYLWHWPVFSLVDYQFYWQPSIVRLTLKITISFAATALSYYLIETPGRILLNSPAKRLLAFAALACSLATLIPLGLAVRHASYLSADASAVHSGGRRFNARGRSGSMVLMGDSNGSMYGQVANEIARERDLRLSVISVEAGDPLPYSTGANPKLWRDSLAVVQRERPDFLLLVCNWGKLRDDPDRLTLALRQLKPYARMILLITQPPILPGQANREAIRDGSRPPFLEDAADHLTRLQHNALVKSSQGENVQVVDIEPIFSRETGEIRFVDDRRTQLFQDRDHLSDAGAILVKPALMKAMAAGLTASR